MNNPLFTQTGTKHVRAWRDGQFLYVEPPCEDVLGPVLATRAWTPRGVADGLGCGRRREVLYEVESCLDRPVLKCWMGLADLVCIVLDMRGYAVSCSGFRYRGGLEDPHSPAIPEPLTDFVCDQDRGLIRYDPDVVSQARLIERIVRAWPELRINVVAAREKEAHAMARQLRNLGVDAIGLTRHNRPMVENRVTVTTYVSMIDTAEGPWWQDIVIALDAAEAIGKQPTWCLEHCWRARTYGLLSVYRQLSTYESDLTRAIFGFHELEMTRAGQVRHPVRVVWLDGAGRGLSRQVRDVHSIKRDGIWHHDARNRQIARIAMALRSDNRDALTCLRNVFVLVENLDHALQLAPKLPGWPIVAHALPNMYGLSRHQRCVLQDRAVSPLTLSLTHGIVTPDGLDRACMPWGDISALVRADGGTGLPELPRRALLASPSIQNPLLVIDLFDRHHLELRRRSEKRRQSYVRNSWGPPNLTPADCRILEFLRPRIPERTLR